MLPCNTAESEVLFPEAIRPWTDATRTVGTCIASFGVFPADAAPRSHHLSPRDTICNAKDPGTLGGCYSSEEGQRSQAGADTSVTQARFRSMFVGAHGSPSKASFLVQPTQDTLVCRCPKYSSCKRACIYRLFELASVGTLCTSARGRSNIACNTAFPL